MTYRKSRKVAFWFVSLNVVFGAFQNCSPMHTPLGSSQNDSSSFSGFSDDFAAQKLSETLQPILRTNCGACHGTSQVPQFAVSDPLLGYAAIKKFQLVDIVNPANSYFLTKIRGGHNGFTETEVQEILAGINMWASALAGTVNPVDQENPGVLISLPIAAATVSGSITLTALATDNVGVASVQFLVDGVPAGAADTTSPYSVSFNTLALSNGNHNITAIATDTSGNTGTSAITTVNVMNILDTTLPVVALTAPADASAATGTITISATATDNIGVVGVQFMADGVAIGLEDTTSPFSISFNTASLANGTRSITARARDAAGNVATSAARSIIVNNSTPDTVLPTVTLTAPASGASVSGSVAITANASDNIGVVGVQFLVNGVASGAEDTTSPYSITWNTTGLASGTYTLAARARDAAGNMTTSANRTVTVANGNPNATFTWISMNILNPRCINCHGAVKADKGIRYNTYANTKLTVVDGNPGASDLYRFTQNGNMPVGGARLTAVQLQAISDWITAGAPNN